MSDRDQYGFKTAATPVRPTGTPVTPGNILTRPTTRRTLDQAQSTSEHRARVPQSDKRPLSFSKRPAQPVRPQAPAQRVEQPKPKKTRTFHPAAWILGSLEFTLKHFKKIALITAAVVSTLGVHSCNDKNEDQRARLNNEPLSSLTPPTEKEAAIQYAMNMVPSPSKQMKNGRNTAFDQEKMKNGAISAVTDGLIIDPLAPKGDGSKDASFHTSGIYAGTTGANLGNTLIVNEGGHISKGIPVDKPHEDQARVSYTISLDDPDPFLNQPEPKRSPTQARRAAPKNQRAVHKSVTPARIMKDPRDK